MVHDALPSDAAMSTPNRSAHLAVLTANLIYGANYSIAKKVMPEFVEAFGFIFIRVLVTAAIFFVIGSMISHRKVERADLPRFFMCAVFGVALNQLLFFKGLDLTTPINASLMMTTNPIMVLLAASLLIREKITMRKIAGIITGISGALLLLVWGKQISFSSDGAAGDFMVLINSLSFGIFMIIVKPLMQKYDTLTVMKWVFLFGALLVTPFGWSEFKAVKWETFHTETWWALTYVVIGTTSVAYLLNTYALKTLSPSAVSIYIYLQPLFATFFAIALGKDTLQVTHFVAALLIFAGVYLVTAPNRKENPGRWWSEKKN